MVTPQAERCCRCVSLAALPAAAKRGLAALALLLAALQAPGATAQQLPVGGPAGAVILVYQRFGEQDMPSASIRLDQFEEHVALLSGGAYNVMPLEEVVAALAAGAPLPDRTVAITVDAVHRSVYTQAFPRLNAAGLPFTVFVDTDAVGRVAGSLTWDELREMAAAGVAIGAHGAGRAHMAALDRGALEEDMARMSADFLDELGAMPRLFSYPYGEFGAETVAMVRDAGFRAAFGQHSGVAAAGADPFTLPRFALNERYGEPERFRTIVDALPLAASDIVPADPLLVPGQPNPPPIGFTVDPAVGDLGRLGCYASHDDDLAMELLGRRVELRLAEPMPPGRSRVNCTLPTDDGRFRWLGLPFLVPGAALE